MVPNTGPQTCLSCDSSKFSFSKYAQILNSVNVSSVVVLLQKPSHVELVIYPEWKPPTYENPTVQRTGLRLQQQKEAVNKIHGFPTIELPALTVANWMQELLTGVKGVKICSSFRIRSAQIADAKKLLLRYRQPLTTQKVK